MPEGLTKMEQMKWKREQKNKGGPAPAPAPPAVPPATPAPPPTPPPATPAPAGEPMPEGLTKMEQMKWKRENKEKAAAGGPAGPPPPAPAADGAAAAEPKKESMAERAARMKAERAAKGPAPPAAPGPAPAAAAAAVEVDMSAMPEGLSKMEQMKVRLCAIHPSIGSPPVRLLSCLPVCTRTRTRFMCHCTLEAAASYSCSLLTAAACAFFARVLLATQWKREAKAKAAGS